MKLRTFVTFFLLSVAFASCGSKADKKAEETADVMKAQEAILRQLIDEGYVPFVNRQYELRITREEAAARGINDQTYDKMLQMLEDGNKMIQGNIEEFRNDSTIKTMILNGDTIFFDRKTKQTES